MCSVNWYIWGLMLRSTVFDLMMVGMEKGSMQE